LWVHSAEITLAGYHKLSFPGVPRTKSWKNIVHK
jgi:hypothetical protein